MIKHKASWSKEQVLISNLFSHFLFLTSLLCSYYLFLSIILVYLSYIAQRDTLFKILGRWAIYLFAIIIRIVICEVEIVVALYRLTLLLFRLHFLHHLTIRLIIWLGLTSSLCFLLFAYDFWLFTFFTAFFRFFLWLFLFLCLFRWRWLRSVSLLLCSRLGWIKEISIIILFWIIIFVSWLFV